MMPTDDVAWTEAFLAEKVPRGDPLHLTEPIQPDEARWFRAAVESGLFEFHDCTEGCGRLRKWNESGPDEFLTPNGQKRHLFGFATHGTCGLSGEYVPHIGAVARLILEFGYDRKRYSFSLYRKFSRDLIAKREGGSYETDAEFYDKDGSSIWLHVEAKRTRKQAESLAAAVEDSGFESSQVVKELEYVLDLSPRYLWIVGAGCLDDDVHVYEVEVDGVAAKFNRLPEIPGPPGIA